MYGSVAARSSGEQATIASEIAPIQAVQQAAVSIFAMGRAYSSELGFKRTTRGGAIIDETPWLNREDGSQISVRQVYNSSVDYSLCSRTRPGGKENILAQACSDQDSLQIYLDSMSEQAVQQEFERIEAEIQAKQRSSYRALGQTTLMAA